MLFKPEHVSMILKGTKIVTRRLWKKPMVRINGTYRAKTVMLSKKYFAKILVTNLYRQQLKDMSELDANKEGYNSLVAFKKIWIKINGNWNPEDNPYVIEFLQIDGGR